MNSCAFYNKNNYLLLEKKNIIPENIINDLKKYNLQPLDPYKITMSNYWISDKFKFIICENILNKKTYFYILNNNNELIDIILNEFENNKNIKSYYYCNFTYQGISYCIIYHLFVLYNQFIVHTEPEKDFNNKNKDILFSKLLNMFKFQL